MEQSVRKRIEVLTKLARKQWSPSQLQVHIEVLAKQDPQWSIGKSPKTNKFEATVHWGQYSISLPTHFRDGTPRERVKVAGVKSQKPIPLHVLTALLVE